MKKIIPAILTDDPADLKEKLQALRGVTDWIQIDIMDGEFVEWRSVSLEEVAEAKPAFDLDIHLMVNDPQHYFLACQKLGAKRVIFQLEGSRHPGPALKALYHLGIERGVALRPDTSLDKLKPHLDHLDVVLLLSVQPGRQGQQFIPATLDKIEKLKGIKPEVKVEVDGGVNAENIVDIAQAGADYIVVGSSIIKTADPTKSFKELQKLISDVR